VRSARFALAVALLVAMTLFAGYSALTMRADGLGLLLTIAFMWGGTEAIHALAVQFERGERP